MRDAMSFATSYPAIGARRARHPGTACEDGAEAFKTVMTEPLEDLPAVYRELPIYYITNRFTVVGTGHDGPLAALQRGDGLRARVRDRDAAHARQHSPERSRARISSATRSSTISPRATGRRSKCRAGSDPPRARASTAPMCSAPGSSRRTRSAIRQTLKVEVRVNGETRATGDTREMLFSVRGDSRLCLAGRDDSRGRVLRLRHCRQLLRPGDRALSSRAATRSSSPSSGSAS